MRGFEDPFTLRSENTPQHLHHLFNSLEFRRCTLEEVLESEDLTQDAWPGMIPSNKHDLTARNLINAPMCGAFTNNGKMIAYTRLLWGYDDQGKPEIHSHMTAVYSTLRDGGVGESLKWLARQVAQNFPVVPVNELSVTFDNLQGRISHVNLNKLGVVCGDAGGLFKHDIYGELPGKQHRGNPTDRYHARWYLDSDWVLAHLEKNVNIFSTDEVKSFPQTVNCGYIELSDQDNLARIPVPTSVNTHLDRPYVTLACPLNWNELLRLDQSYDLLHVKQWRQAHRAALNAYHSKGYTTVLQASDDNAGINLQVLAKDFDPYRPPPELLG